MSDAREFALDGRTFRLVGLSGAADDVRAAANRVSDLIDSRVRLANAALRDWTGPHGVTFASQVTGILAAMTGFEAALRDRAALLEYFPSSNPGGHPTSAAARVQAPSASGKVSADTDALRAYVASTANHPASLRPLPDTVTTNGVRGSYTYERALTGWERQRYLDRGWPVAEVDVMRVSGQKVMSAGEVAALIAVSPVDGHVEPIVAAANALDAFVFAVAMAIDTSDAGLQDLLAFAPGAGGAVQAQTIGALVAHLQDPYLSAEQMAATLGAVNAITLAQPSAADEFVLALGPSGVNAVVDRLGSYAWEMDPAWIEQSLLSPFAALVRQATAPGHLADDQVARLADGLSLPSLALLLSSGARFDPRLLESAMEALWSASYFVLDTNPLTAALFHDDYGVAAINGLLANPEFAAAWLNGDHQFLEDIATSGFRDDGAAAGALLANVYYERVLADLADDPTMQASLDASEAALALLIPKSGFNDGAKVALAQIGTLHYQDISSIAENDIETPGLPGVTREGLVDFYDSLFGSETALMVASAGLGDFLVGGLRGRLDDADVVAASAEGVWDEFGNETKDAGELSRMFMEALAKNSDAEAASHNFWLGLGNSVASTLATAGIGAAGVTGGTSAVAGAGAKLVIDWGTGRIPKPSLDATGRAINMERMFQASAVSVIVDDDALLSKTSVDPEALAFFRDDEQMARVLSGDPQAVDAFVGYFDGSAIKNDVLALLAPLPVAESHGG